MAHSHSPHLHQPPPFAEHAHLAARILATLLVLVAAGVALGGATGWLLSQVALWLLG
ncbi:hypothetical protein ISU10_17540 [Nocardioides agariphilus]|jgi:hypothetical protein|uniref:Uncharacterized protein n=1 Tax=Nocardioides agariphilus TaxID=433664 RepID=A0A930YJV7_9ACTN|nr:hypothetical protein [Nocardioides agariphilus]MBF4769573.1 hypothetical protein [Nocardioides agariphilus]